MTNELNVRCAHALSIAYMHFLVILILIGIFFVVMDNKTSMFLGDRKKR